MATVEVGFDLARARHATTVGGSLGTMLSSLPLQMLELHSCEVIRRSSTAGSYH